MATACLEHLNLTVENPDLIAEHLCQLFDWSVRWSGPALNGGYTVHVGTEQRYLALYTHENTSNDGRNPLKVNMANHIGLVVKDLDSMETTVLEKGFKTENHRDYGVCKSFYFMIDTALEIEVLCYQ